MPTSEHIKRIRTDPDGLDFETLRKEAIHTVQDLCGEIWTDYNLHDPGVTILEQLCYGLTDLSYRSGFEVQDYLTDKRNVIDYERQALFSPEEIFPSSTVTEIDYQKILFDAIPETDYIWLEPYRVEDGSGIEGLYTIFVKIDDDLTQSNADLPKQNDHLNPISGKLKQMGVAVDKVRTLLDQLGDRLDGWHEEARKGRDDVSNRHVSAQAPDALIDQVSKTLHQLDISLSYLDSVWNQMNDVWSVMVDSPLNDDLIARFNEVFPKLDAVFGYTKLINALNNNLSAIESAPDQLSIHADLLMQLTIPLSRFENALSKLDQVLQGIGNGLFTQIEVSSQTSASLSETAIRQRILSIFAKHRNLCEDVHRIEVIKTIPYFLVGEVEIKPGYSTAKIYAEIFIQCAHYVASGIQVERYESIIQQSGDYEQIFSGPLTKHGYINDQCFEVPQDILSVVDLITLINQIEGVIQVHDLYLIDQDNKKYKSLTYDSSKHIFPDLCFPKSGKPMQILRLVLPQNTSRKQQGLKTKQFESSDAKEDEALLEETRLELRKLIFEYHAFRNNPQSFQQLIRLPKGQYRALADYSSIQNQFPAIYGINQYGIPRSKPADIKAKAKQLKAYLFPFEQLMANYLENLKEIASLFSLDAELKQSYFLQCLSDQNIPDIESLYVESQEHSQTLLSDMTADRDRFIERRNRVLDTLLAMYGEQYPQQSLLQFDCYLHTDPGHWIIHHKINYLKCIREITRDRAKGFNYLKPILNAYQAGRAENITGAHKRISILLGLNHPNSVQSMTGVLLDRNSRLIPDRVVAAGVDFLSPDMENNAVSIAFDANKYRAARIPAKLPPLSYSIFKEGIELENYRLITADQKTIVCLKSSQNERLWPLGSKNSVDEAESYAHEFCHAMNRLNMACENLHIIEHLLLRPRDGAAFDNIVDGDAFFNCRVSIIFPAWTARFSDQAFRKFAQETVLNNLPAHIFPKFYWLDFVYMQDFEQRYKTWLACLQQSHVNPHENSCQRLNQASERLIAFLLKNKQEAEREYWI